MATDTDHEHHIDDYRSSLDDPQQSPSSPSSILNTLPASPQSQQNRPKRLSISTALDLPPPSSTERSLESLDSPDAHEFYRRYRDSAGGALGTSVLRGDHHSLGTGSVGSMIASAGPRSPPSSKITSNASSKYQYPQSPSRTNSVRLSYKGSTTSSTNISPLGAAKSHPALTSTRGPSQGSLKDLVDKFNGKHDEISPPLPYRNHTLPSSNLSSRARLGSNFHNTPVPRSSSDRQRSIGIANGSEQSPKRGRHFKYSENRESDTPNIGNIRKPHTQSASIESTASMRPITGLKNSSSSIAKPLFGEVLNSRVVGLDLGYGMPPRKRRQSDGSMYSPNPTFCESQIDHDTSLFTSSPTAWYRNFQPNFDGSGPSSPSRAHRRTRSDLDVPIAGSSISVKMNLNPSESEVSHGNNASSSTSSTPSKHSTVSRIPISTQRPSLTSDTGNPSYSTRASASTSIRSNSALGFSGTHSVSASRGASALPIPVQRALSPAISREDKRKLSQRPGAFSPTRDQAEHKPVLKAYISAPPPKTSPPLRSSRPRQPVSAASTAASRARAVDRSHNTTSQKSRRDVKSPVPEPRRFPELGNVDFAARRQRIQQAFNRTVRENEREAERKRLAKQEKDKEKKKAVEVAAKHQKDKETHEIEKIEKDEHEDETLAREKLEQSSGSGLNVKEDIPEQKENRDSMHESVNHGNQEELEIPKGDSGEDHERLSVESSVYQTAPSSSSSQNDTPSMNEDSPTFGASEDLPLQDSSSRKAKEEKAVAVIPPSPKSVAVPEMNDTGTLSEKMPADSLVQTVHGTILSQVMHLRDDISPSPSQSENVEDGPSDKDDGESVQIMLGATPVNEQNPLNHINSNQSLSTVRPDRRSGSSWTSSMDSTDDSPASASRTLSLERIEESPFSASYAVTRFSSSTATSDQTPQAWSPSRLSSLRTGQSTMDSESYNIVYHILEEYYTAESITPELVRHFQQFVLERSPDLSRQSEWDFRRFTEQYLHEYTRERVACPSALPKPLNAELREKEGSVIESSLLKDADQSSTSTEFEKDDSEEIADPSRNEISGTINDEAISKLKEDVGDHPAKSADHFENEDDDQYRPIPPPKDSPKISRFSSPEFSDAQKESISSGPRGSVFHLSVDTGPQLPEIERTEGVLGLAIHVESPHDNNPPTIPLPPLPNHSPPLPTNEEEIHKPADEPQATSLQSPPSPSIYSRYPPSSTIPTGTSLRMAETFSVRSSEEVSERPEEILQSAQASGTSSITQDRISLDQQSRRSTEVRSKSSSPTPEERRLTKRKNIIRELIETEHSFGQDMKVVDDIYKGTSASCLDLSPEDIKILFGNSDQIVAFSNDFLDSLKQAGKSVYIMPRSRRFRKRTSAATSLYSQAEDQASTMGTALTEDDLDRRTFIGEVFGQHMQRMEKVYSDYLKNHDAANRKLQDLQKHENVNIWLNECRQFANDLTSAWDLDSLLVKPVQRILKYPLLLAQLLETTPENHPDYTALNFAVREMTEVSRRINDMKRRVDIIEQVVSKRKRKDSDVRAGLSKAFGRRTEKLRLQVGLSGGFEDKEYDALAERFDAGLVHLHLVHRDVEKYIQEVQAYVDRFNSLVSAIEEYIESGQSNHPELESKWRKFRMSVRDISGMALREHVYGVRKHVADPISVLLKLHGAPQKLVEKRTKRLTSYTRYKAIKEKGDKPDKKTTDQGEQFLGLHETLKFELPTLMALTTRCMEYCLHAFIEVQQQWHVAWQKKISIVLDENDIPQDISDIIPQWKGDFDLVEAQLLGLGICNGSTYAEAINMINFLSPSTTIDGSSIPSRPSTNSIRTYSQSMIGDSSSAYPGYDISNRRSGSHASSTLVESILQSTPGLYHTASYASSRTRLRTSSGATTRDASAAEESNGRPSLPADGSNNMNMRPLTSGGRTVDPSPILPQLSIETPSFHDLHPESTAPPPPPPLPPTALDTQQPSIQSNDRFTSPFSSALPLSDSPVAQTPAPSQSEKQYGRLFTAVSMFEFKIDRQRQQGGYPFLTYDKSEIFDIVGQNGELWLAINQDDTTKTAGWIWEKHFMRIVE
ncbi:MAG: hypothetical protein M1834_006310 [Cirrosporium novae-zelandiae]|nr:MAG: hypothetical protein M1834_006310 [Cirrosporium novae-zelandiae]